MNLISARQTGTEGDDLLVGLPGDDKMFGLGGADTLVGELGNDILNGGTGDDLLEGLLGDDTVTYVGAGGSVRIDLRDQSGSGADGDDVYIDVENAIGGAFDDVLLGAGDSNRLDGRGGADSIFGRNGADTLVGGAGRDEMSGGRGKDVFFDGAGRDVMRGGPGADRYVFVDSADIRGDRISDLSKSDTIDLRGVDANSLASADQDFHLVDQFTGVAAELQILYVAHRDWTVFRGDLDGDGKADIVIRADGDHTDFANLVL